MHTEYQINIDYADGSQAKHLTFIFKDAESRNEMYQLICSKYNNDRVDMEHLRNNGGMTVSTYNYSEPVRNEMAQFVPHSSFRIEILNEVLEMVSQEAIN